MTEVMDEATRKKIHDFLIGRRADQFTVLMDLVRTPSENPGSDMSAIRDKVSSICTDNGLEVVEHKVPKELTEPLDMERQSNLVVRREFSEGPVIALSCHVDTAPAGERWSYDPFGAVITDGQIFSRGVAEGKGDFAAYLFTLLALEPVAENLAGSVELHVTFDGVSGGTFGAKWLLDNDVVKPDIAILPGVSGAVGTKSTSVLNLDVKVLGATAPAGQPANGRDALEGASAVLSRLYEHRSALAEQESAIPGVGSPSLVVTEIAGGNGQLTVPDEVELTVDRRILPEESVDAVESELINIIGRAAAQVPGIISKVRRQRLLRGLEPTDDLRNFVDMLRAHLDDFGFKNEDEYGVSGETPARHYSAAGIPTLLYGAGGDFRAPANIAGPDESLALDDLRTATEVLSRTICQWLWRDSSVPDEVEEPASEPEEAVSLADELAE